MELDGKKALVIVGVVIAVIVLLGGAYITLGGSGTTVVRQGPKPAPGQVWGKKAMIMHDNSAGGSAHGSGGDRIGLSRTPGSGPGN